MVYIAQSAASNFQWCHASDKHLVNGRNGNLASSFYSVVLHLLIYKHHWCLLRSGWWCQPQDIVLDRLSYWKGLVRICSFPTNCETQIQWYLDRNDCIPQSLLWFTLVTLLEGCRSATGITSTPCTSLLVALHSFHPPAPKLSCTINPNLDRYVAKPNSGEAIWRLSHFLLTLGCSWAIEK